VSHIVLWTGLSPMAQATPVSGDARYGPGCATSRRPGPAHTSAAHDPGELGEVENQVGHEPPIK
jgi:hypothetical protein